MRGDNAPNQEAEGVTVYGQLPFSRMTIRVTSGYEMKSELFADWCGVCLRLHVSLDACQKTHVKKSSMCYSFSPVQTFSLWFDLAAMSHVSLLVVAHEICFKINLVGI